nr:type I restriction enzyme endonuclease domain-containing protein [Cellulosimicrobium sp. CUA-896]
MARAAKMAAQAKTLEQRLWEAADALRANQGPSAYKHVVLGLVFLKSDAAVLQMGDDTPKKMAAELVTSIRQSDTLGWNLKDSVRAAMRTKVRRLLAKYDYPPDLEEKAIELVLEQAELYASVDGGAPA